MTEERLSFCAAALSVTAAVLGQCVLSPAAETPVRRAILFGLPLALLLGVLAALAAVAQQKARLFSGEGIGSRLVCLLMAIWFCAELIETVYQLHSICWEQFSSRAALGLLPILLWAGWNASGQILSRSARILWWLVLIGTIICVAGLAEQLHWENLMQTETAELHLPRVPLYAEFFSLPLLCSHRAERRAFQLPLGAFAVWAGYAFGLELLFGAAQRDGLLGVELLRAWVLGAFSRFDAAFLLIWLAAAMFRICVLTQILRTLVRRLWGKAYHGCAEVRP